MDKIFVTAEDLVEMGLLTSRFTAADAVKRGELPPPTRVGQRHVWKREDVMAHFDARKGKTHFTNGLSADRKRKVVRA